MSEDGDRRVDLDNIVSLVENQGVQAVKPKASSVVEARKEKGTNLLTIAKTISRNAIGKLQETAKNIKPDTVPEVAATMLLGTLAATEMYAVFSGIHHVVPPGGDFLNGLREFVSVNQYVWSHLDDLPNGEERLQAALAVTAPYMAGIFTFLTAATGIAAYKDQTRTQQ